MFSLRDLEGVWPKQVACKKNNPENSAEVKRACPKLLELRF